MQVEDRTSAFCVQKVNKVISKSWLLECLLPPVVVHAGGRVRTTFVFASSCC